MNIVDGIPSCGILHSTTTLLYISVGKYIELNCLFFSGAGFDHNILYTHSQEEHLYGV